MAKRYEVTFYLDVSTFHDGLTLEQAEKLHILLIEDKLNAIVKDFAKYNVATTPHEKIEMKFIEEV